MKEYQKRVDKWVSQYKIGYWKPLEILARLAEEVGELARELNYRFGPKIKKKTDGKQNLEDEVADIIFTLFCFANSLGLDIDAGFNRVMDKCYGRDKDRWEKK